MSWTPPSVRRCDTGWVCQLRALTPRSPLSRFAVSRTKPGSFCSPSVARGPGAIRRSNRQRESCRDTAVWLCRVVLSPFYRPITLLCVRLTAVDGGTRPVNRNVDDDAKKGRARWRAAAPYTGGAEQTSNERRHSHGHRTPEADPNRPRQSGAPPNRGNGPESEQQRKADARHQQRHLASGSITSNTGGKAPTPKQRRTPSLPEEAAPVTSR